MPTILSRWEGRLATRRRLRDDAQASVNYWSKQFHAVKKGTIARSHAYVMVKAAKGRLALRDAQVRYAERVVSRHRGEHPEPARGIDISSNNGSVNFTAVARAGYDFVYVKATEGTTYKNPFFLAAVKSALSHGLRVGAYHYLKPGNGDGQAAVFSARAKAAGLGHGDLMPACDVEATGVTTADVKAFVEGVKRRLGVDCLIYTSPAFLHWPSVYGCGLWVAHYGVAAPALPNAWTKYLIWQHSQTGKVSGVVGNCDLNICPDITAVIA